MIARQRGRKQILGRLLLVFGALLAQAGPVSEAYAAKAKKEAPAAAKEKSYMAPYGLVVLGVVLGLILVCRPVRRADEPKRLDREANE